MAKAGEIEGRKPVDVWVGTALGILKGMFTLLNFYQVLIPPLSFKGVSLSSHEVTNYHKCLERSDVTQEVCAMCWEHGDRGETLYCGLKNGLVQRFSCRERVFEAECDCTGGEGTFVGLEKHEK